MCSDEMKMLKAFCDADGVSGFEEGAARVIAKEIKPYCDELYIDAVGNLVAYKKGKTPGGTPTVYCAHLDEVGFMIRYINEDGTLLFEQVGMTAEVLPAKRVLVGRNRVPGVIGALPVHLQREKGEKAPGMDEMYIDIGAKDRIDAERFGVYADYAVFDNDFRVFGTNDDRVRSKALDDRFGCFVMARMLQTGTAHDAYFVFTRGEELGGVGATAMTRELDAKNVIVFEATTASDLPCNKGADRVCELTGGAVVPFMDGGTRYDHELYENIRALAKAHGVPTQTKTHVAGGTDAASIQRAMSGVRVAAVSLPCRYIHSGSCVASRKDMDAILTLAKLIDENADVLFDAARTV